MPLIQQAAQKTSQITPPDVFGRMSLKALIQQIDKANPDADRAIKFGALAMAQKMLAPDEQMQMKLFMQQNQADLRVALAEFSAANANQRAADTQAAAAARSDSSKWDFITKPDGSIVRANRATGEVEPAAGLPAGSGKLGSSAQQAPPELKVPDQWEGMPNKAPPGVRQDVWQGSLEYVRTGKMPAMGFQPGMRNLIFQASPAAAQALGMEPSKIADLQAQYAGERHGEIVGGGRAANIELGIQEAKKAAPQVVETSKAVPRTEFPPLNQFTNWLQEKTGDPNIVAFREALNTYLNVYASTVSRTGRLTDAQQRHAYELLSTAFSQGQIDHGIQQLDYEMSLMQESVEPAMQNIQRLGQPPAIKPQQTPATPPQAQQPSAPAAGGASKVIKLDADGNVIP